MTTYVLAEPAPPPVPPRLDEYQQQVVDHREGPLLVLAGPGTGKTTTLVEAVVDRVESRGADPSQILALTFSRKAAGQLRDRITARLGRTTSHPMAWTFHSFAYALIRRYAPADLYAAPLRLITAAEQDVVIRELLLESEESITLPEWLDQAASTRGFAREVAAVLSRAREKGLDAKAIHDLGKDNGIEEFVAAGWFAEQYLTVLDSMGATDYADLIRRAVIEARAHAPELQREFRHIFVDEYQDTDPGQVALLQAIAGDSAEIIVVGDPHQSIYGFRGAEVRGILDFPDQFRKPDGSKADVVVLQTTRRYGRQIAGVARQVAQRLPLAGAIEADRARDFLDPVVQGPDGGVEVITYDTERAEVERIADLLRRAHLTDGVPWSQMAILVRSGKQTLAGMRRALSGLGVPVEVAGDDIPLIREPAVERLLAVLRLISTPEAATPADVVALLSGPVAGLDAAEVRAAARDLLAAAREAGQSGSATELLAAAVRDPGPTTPEVVRPFASLLADATKVAEHGTPEEVLWVVWSRSPWPARLQRQIAAGGAAALRAHRDLDAICALFDLAAKTEEQRTHGDLRTFMETLAAQQIPADSLAERGVRGDGVRLLTAHRSKGLEWDLVVVAHVQEGTWPDLRRRATLLGADRLGTTRYGEAGLSDGATIAELLADERRLFYVACTRARHRLVVTAVASQEEDGEQPSRFLAETGQEAVHLAGRPPRPLTLAGVVAELRQTVADPQLPDDIRAAAGARLAQLRDAGVRSADPANWWGMRDWSEATPLVAPEEVLRLSPSTVKDVLTCPAQWFLKHEAGGTSRTNQKASFGSVVHALAEHVAAGSIAADLDQLMGYIDQIWDQLAFRTPWSGTKERVVVREVLERFLDHHQRPDAREIEALEQRLDAEVELPDGTRLVVHGYADRVEVDVDGKVVVVDLKTTTSYLTQKDVPVDPQLGIYQLAVNNGALGEGREAGSAELWQLRAHLSGKTRVQRQEPQTRDEDGWLPVERQLAEVAAAIRGERFPARPGVHCRYCDFQHLCPAKTSGTVLT